MTYPQDPYQQGGYDPYTKQPYSQDPYQQQTHAQPAYVHDPYAQQGYGHDPYAQGYGQDPYAQQAYGYGYDPYGYPGYGQPGTNGLATGSLVTSIVGIVVCTLACPVGAILGHVALGRIRESGQQGRGMALAGVIIGWIGTALLVGVIVLFVVLGVTGNLE